MATNIINRLSVQRDFSVASRKRANIMINPSRGQDISEDDQEIVSAQDRDRIAQRAASLAHQAAPPAHKAATLAHKAAYLGPAQQQAALHQEHSVDPSRIRERLNATGERKSHHKTSRDVFLPRSLREEHQWRSETADHGWLEIPDHASDLISRGHMRRGVDKGHVSSIGVRNKDPSLEAQYDTSIAWLDEVPRSSPGDVALQKARERNVRRLREATANDCRILSKYLPSDISVFFPFGLMGPDDYYQPSQIG